MKLTVQQAWDAHVGVVQIINANRAMSLKARYLLSRMHAKLKPEYDLAVEQQAKMRKDYDTLRMEKMINPDGSEVELPTDEYIVPKDKQDDFNQKWKSLIAQEIDVDVSPIGLTMLDQGDDPNGVTASELVLLGCLVTDDDNAMAGEILPPERRLNIN